MSARSYDDVDQGVREVNLGLLTEALEGLISYRNELLDDMQCGLESVKWATEDEGIKLWSDVINLGHQMTATLRQIGLTKEDLRRLRGMRPTPPRELP